MQSGNEIWPVYAVFQNNSFIKKFYEKYGLGTKRFCGGQHADLNKF